MLSTTKKKLDDNEQNTQALFLSLITYNLEASSTDFLILYFFV